MKMEQVENAIGLALKYHKGQLYEGGNISEPYILHCLRVMTGLETAFQDEVGLSAAVLHDVMEDCGVTRGMLLQSGIRTDVIEIVEVLTRRKNEESYAEYIKRVGANHYARAIKLSDLKTNLDFIWRLPEEKAQRLMKRYMAARESLVRGWNAEIDALYKEI